MWKEFFKERCVLNSKHLGAIKHGVSWNTLAVGDATGEVLLRIEALLRRLRSMGDDELRMVWLPVKGRTKEWLQVAFSEYEGRHFLQLRLQEAYIMSLSYDERKSEPKTFALDNLTEMLTQIEGYLRAVVEGIEKDASGYNAYVEANLDPVCRKGYIPIRSFTAHCPLSVLEVDRKDEVLALLQDPPTPYKFDVMTLRTYRKIRRIAHEAVYGHMEGSDEEVLGLSSGIREMLSYDLDSPEAFEQWRKSYHYSHCFDVVYARVHLVPCQETDGVQLSLWTASGPYIPHFSKVLLGLTAAGYPPILGDVTHIQSILTETCRVRITSFPTHYMNRSDAPIECRLPFKSELGIKRYNELVRSVTWDPINQVLPV